MFVNRNGELETDGTVPVIPEDTLKHDNSGFTFDNGPYFVMERFENLVVYSYGYVIHE